VEIAAMASAVPPYESDYAATHDIVIAMVPEFRSHEDLFRSAGIRTRRRVAMTDKARRARSASCAILLALAINTPVFWVGHARADSYIFDRKHSEVRFTYYIGVLPNSGLFTDVRGQLDIDPQNPEKSNVVATIKTASLTTPIPAVEDQLKGRGFFNVAAQPEIRFQSRALRLIGPQKAELVGDITINGIVKPATLKVHLSSDAVELLKNQQGTIAESNRPWFTATARIRRSSFNMTALAELVNDEVDIEIVASLRKKR
jgi:polyisoprenoid-binding protein YceI